MENDGHKGRRPSLRAIGVLAAAAAIGASLIGASGASGAVTYRPCEPPRDYADDGGIGYIVLGYYEVEGLRASLAVPCRKAKSVSASMQYRYYKHGRCLNGSGNCHVGQYVCRHAGDGSDSDRWVCKKDRAHKIRFRIGYREATPPPDY